MIPENPFSEPMKKRSNAELLVIVGKLRNGYQPEAVLAAETELKKRHLSEEKIERIKKTNLKKKSVSKRTTEPFDFHWILIALLFPNLLSVFIKDKSKIKEYGMQSKHIRKYFFYCIGIGVVLFILALIYNVFF